MGAVKRSRKERAAETRRRMLDAAFACFTEAGYAGTTMAAIADRAGVAVQTLYFTFHTKSELLAEVFERAVLGDDEPVPPEERDWYRAAMTASDPHTAMTLFATGVADIVARVAPLRPVFDGAAGEPGVAELWQRGERLREEGYLALLDAVTKRHPLRPGVDLRQALDTSLVLIGPVGHRGFVEDRGWTLDEWVRWVANTLTEVLFTSATAARPSGRA